MSCAPPVASTVIVGSVGSSPGLYAGEV